MQLQDSFFTCWSKLVITMNYGTKILPIHQHDCAQKFGLAFFIAVLEYMGREEQCQTVSLHVLESSGISLHTINKKYDIE